MKTSKTQQTLCSRHRATISVISARSIALLMVFQMLACFAFAQATMTNSGNWATAGNWSGNNIGDVVTETVDISNTVSPTINNGSSYTVGSTTLSNNNTLTINSGGTLNIGNSTTAATLTTNNNANMVINGTLIIWGDVNVNNNIHWNITGTVIIKGNLIMSNNANIVVAAGTVTVSGNFTSGGNTNVTVSSGGVAIGGNVNVGTHSNLSACASCFTRVGTCTGPASFCGNTTLPIKLVEFAGEAVAAGNNIHWVTSMERNFDYFELERADKDLVFETIATIKGKGGLDVTTSYQFVDTAPLVGNNYYRLKSVDLDGSFEYSDVIVAELTGNSDVKIYPTLVSDGSFSVQLSDSYSKPVRLEMTDAMGHLVYVSDLTETISTIEFPTSVLPGIYQVKLSSNQQVIARIFRK
ncbi:MAG TPA: hypothetical protein VIM75_12920 [Ohtaekwangia sp.]|uniref:hypothetical protein n=1 Tax=Ohtaekwangia sp. TaxID=2066019 RepID=UPI002F9214F0